VSKGGPPALRWGDVRLSERRLPVSAIPSAPTGSRPGSPLPRLQKILGHATPAMTLRYTRHAPEAFFAGDAAAIEASLSGKTDREADAVVQAVIRSAETA
jgi:hypothetical protein